eukprot:5961289-Prymnesium_polylepis.1
MSTIFEAAWSAIAHWLLGIWSLCQTMRPNGLLRTLGAPLDDCAPERGQVASRSGLLSWH